MQDPDNLKGMCIVVKRLQAWGVREVKIIGGEPMLYPNLAVLLSEAKALGLSISIITGGSAGSVPVWEGVLDHADEVWFSLYHLDPLKHDFLVRRRGSLSALKQHLGRAVARSNVRVGVNLLLNNLVLDDLPEVLEQLCKIKGLVAIKMLWPTPQGEALQHWGHYSIPYGRWRDICLMAAHANARAPQIKIAVAKHVRFELGEFTPCDYGSKKLWGVDPEGFLYPCCLLIDDKRYALGQVSELSAPVVLEKLARLQEEDAARALGPLACNGSCPALVNDKGWDRRADALSIGEELSCPLAQWQCHAR